MKRQKNYVQFEAQHPDHHPVKAWINGVPCEEEAKVQLRNVASLPFIYKWVAAMPDVHFGKGATVGSVIPTEGAVIPAAVGVDLGCGMFAVETTLKAKDLPNNLAGLRSEIESAVPHGRTHQGKRGDRGAWGRTPERVEEAWGRMEPAYRDLARRHPKLGQGNDANHLGTLGSGNHFIEICLDEKQSVWILLHSGSRGVGARIGLYFISLAREDMREHIKNLPDRDLAYLKEGTRYFRDYVEAVSWAQDFAETNRKLMMEATLAALKRTPGIPPFEANRHAINCHHNYVARESHYGKSVYVTRKGAVSAKLGELGIIPGSMGARSYIVRGKGNPESFHSCSHGAGRRMSRNEAKKTFTLSDHRLATHGIECRKDAGVIDETPGAYKDIDAVMAAQSDLVEIVHRLKQVVVVKG